MKRRVLHFNVPLEKIHHVFRTSLDVHTHTHKKKEIDEIEASVGQRESNFHFGINKLFSWFFLFFSFFFCVFKLTLFAWTVDGLPQ